MKQFLTFILLFIGLTINAQQIDTLPVNTKEIFVSFNLQDCIATYREVEYALNFDATNGKYWILLNKQKRYIKVNTLYSGN